jgi:hypothetical protein
MKLFAALTAMASALAAAPPIKLDAANLNAAREYAQDAWGYKIASNVIIQPEAMNACVPGRDDVATTTVLTKTSALMTDGIRTELPTTFEYVVRVNSNCRWTQAWLNQVMTHEYGHLLIGTYYHSKNKRSIMYRVTMPSGQCVMDEDKEKVIR